MRREVADLWRAWRRLEWVRRLREAMQREFYRRGWPRLRQRYGRQEGPREGETKPGKHGPLVFREGRWRRAEGPGGGEVAGRPGGSPQGAAGVGKIPRQSSRGVSADRFMEVRSRVTYREAFLSDYSLDDLRKMASEGAQFRLSEDGTAGYILHEGELKNLFCLRRGTGVGKAMLVDAIARGAQRLDCIGPDLAEIYTRFGFLAVRAVKWDDRYARKDWDYEKYNRPDIILMEYRGETRDAEEIHRRAETGHYAEFQHPGYGGRESFARKKYGMSDETKKHAFSIEELVEEGMLREDITEEFLDWLDQEWEHKLRRIAKTKGLEAAKAAETSKPERYWFLQAALL